MKHYTSEQELQLKLKQLTESEERFRRLFENSAEGIIMADPQTKQFKYFNPAICRMLGYSREEMEKMSVSDIHPEESMKLVNSEFEAQLNGRKNFSTNIPVLRKDKKIIYVNVSAVPINMKVGKVLAGFFTDNTKIKEYQDKLAYSEIKYRTIVENIGEWIWEVDRYGRYTYASPVVKKILGYNPEELIGKTPFELIQPVESEKIKKIFQKISEKRKPFKNLKNINVHKNGSEIVLETSALPIFDDNGRFIGYRGIDRDITEREKLEHDRKVLSNALDNAYDGCIIFDKNFTITYTNKSALKLFGHSAESIKEISIDKLFREKTLKKYFYSVLENNNYDWNGKTIGVRKNKVNFPMHLSLSPVRNGYGTVTGVMAVFRDITQLEELETQLFRSQKMEAVGDLAGGVAHDFNNFLSTILGYANLFLEEYKKDDDLKKYIREIREQAEYAAEITKQLLFYARSAKPKFVNFDICPLIIDTVNLLKNTELSKKTDFVLKLDACLNIFGDSTQIQQMIYNICSNALNSMKNENTKKIEIALKQTKLTNETAASILVIPGDYLKLIFKDTGHGISEEILNKIFDPFFTTNSHKNGIGLGLSLVNKIVKKHNGAIKVKSAVGKGTVVTVFLPVAKTDERNEPNYSLQKNTKILIVDDNTPLLELYKTTFEKLGYIVITALTGEEALKIFNNAPDSFDIVITDQLMPGITGSELSTEILKQKPDIPIILATAYSTFSQKEAEQLGIKYIIPKPIEMSYLTRMINSLLKTNRDTE
ncbi:MAG: PAS domain S-box protein [Victivallales bacterium]|nr:PAS domain S-box protein [Victivallales bacterium]